jgi:hypothetical protein
MVTVPKVSVGAAISVAQAARDVLRRVRKKPTAAEAKLLVEFARRLDERRVFSARFDSEIVECCLSSLDSFKSITEDYLAKLEHPGARAALGAMLTSLRRFIDTWHGFATRRIWDGPFPFDRPRFRDEGRTGADFFQDLGSLRAEIRLLIDLLVDIEPKVSVPSIIGS